MKQAFFIVILNCSLIAPATATTFHVGPTQPHTAPSTVMGLVQDGDTVLIDAGLYSGDVGIWTKSNLVIKGVGGYAHLDAAGKNAGGKAIWVIQGSNTYIENIEFSGAAVPDLNGAGIRQEGAGLELRHCYFHDNEDGVLAGDNANSDILFEACEFDHNGHGDGYSHNMYINHVRSFTLRFCYIHRANVGHEVKSRAYRTYVLFNRITDEADGTASYCIDLPNGGEAYIIGNSIQKGPMAQNRQIIRFGEEGQTNPTQEIYIVNNTMVSELPKCTFVALAAATSLTKLYNNLFAGPGTMYDMNISGTIDSSENVYANADPLYEHGWYFIGDSAHYDYHVGGEDFVIPGSNPGTAHGMDLRPSKQYVHPTDSSARSDNGNSIGAFEWRVLDVPTTKASEAGIDVFPNPTSSVVTVTLRQAAIGHTAKLRLFDPLGKNIRTIDVAAGAMSVTFDVTGLSRGSYSIALLGAYGTQSARRELIVR